MSIQSLKEKSEAAVAKVLQTPASSIDQVYSQIFEQIERQPASVREFVSHFLLWMLHSARRDKDNIAMAFTVDWKIGKLGPSQIPTFDDDILVCRNLVTADPKRPDCFTFVHKSAKDYIERRAELGQMPALRHGPFPISEEDRHMVLATTCVGYLYLQGVAILEDIYNKRMVLTEDQGPHKQGEPSSKLYDICSEMSF